MSTTKKIPLFPLGVVLFPGIALPLHIFEDRYKEMIGHCIDNDLEFGVVFHDGENLRTVGCTARVMSVLKTYEDGRMDIISEGEKRFRLASFLDDKSYYEGDVEFLSEEQLDGDKVNAELLQTARALLKKTILRLDASYDTTRLDDLSAREVSYMIAANAGFSAANKQQLLELMSITERLKMAIDWADKLVKKATDAVHRNGIISKNGKH